MSLILPSSSYINKIHNSVILREKYHNINYAVEESLRADASDQEKQERLKEIGRRFRRLSYQHLMKEWYIRIKLRGPEDFEALVWLADLITYNLDDEALPALLDAFSLSGKKFNQVPYNQDVGNMTSLLLNCLLKVNGDQDAFNERLVNAGLSTELDLLARHLASLASQDDN